MGGDSSALSRTHHGTRGRRINSREIICGIGRRGVEGEVVRIVSFPFAGGRERLPLHKAGPNIVELYVDSMLGCT